MKNRKIEKNYIYVGFGFPIVLHDVPMVEIRGKWALDINYNVFQRVVLLLLAHLPAPLTGNHMRFIRKYFALKLVDFGQKLNVTHPAVLKWEKRGDNPANINPMTERQIRLFILDSLLDNDKDFRNAYKKIMKQEFSLKKTTPLHIDAQCELVAI